MYEKNASLQIVYIVTLNYSVTTAAPQQPNAVSRPPAPSEAAEPVDAMTRPPVPLEPTITVVQAPQSPEPVEEGPYPASPVPASPTSAPPTKRRKTAGHKVGFESSWAIERPWVFSAEEDGVEVLMCKLCTTHKPVGVGQRCWVDYGSQTLRKDALLLHEKSMQHRDAVRAAMSHKRDIADGLASMESETQAATEDALKVIYFILRHNLPLDLFADLVELSVDLGSSRLRNLYAGKNATHTSAKTVHGLLRSLSDEVSATITDSIQQSPTYSVMADEVMDVASRKHLAMLCRYVSPDGSTDTVLLNDVEIADGTANTVTAAMTSELQTHQLDVTKMSTLSADGASTFSGCKTGVGCQLRRLSPGLIYYHCRDHRLALACKNSFAGIPMLAKLDHTLDTLHKYYKYSAVHNANLRKVQAAFGEPLRTHDEGGKASPVVVPRASDFCSSEVI